MLVFQTSYDTMTSNQVVDISINFVDGRMVGDVKKSSYGYLQTLGGLTPVPGGVGQCTVIALMENVIQIAEEE